MSRIVILLIVTSCCVHVLYGQKRTVTSYFDDNQSAIKEVYYVNDSMPGMLDGPYVSYYANGKVKSKGSYKNGLPTGEWEYFYENGKLKMKGELEKGSNHGPWKYFFENGQLSMEGEVYNGKRQGEWKHYFEKGDIKSLGEYKDGKKNGIWNYHYEDGSLKAQAYYKEGRGRYKEFYQSGEIKAEGLNIDGKSDSLWTFFYENGKVKAQGNYSEGVKDGYWKFYFPNGDLSSEGHYKNGETDGQWTYYYRNNRKSAEGIQKEGEKDGFWKLYYRSGALKGEGMFNQGDGEYKEYYESGKLRVVGFIENGKSQGKWNYYYEDGKLEGIAMFTRGKGLFKGYYRNGSLKMEGMLKDGIRTGIWKLYKKNGDLAGYYKTVYEGEEPVFKMVGGETETKPAGGKSDTTNYEKPEFRFKSRGSNYFTSRLNEFRGLIIATNPMAMSLGSVPFSVEYYMQERLGHELQYSFIRDPFFTSDSNVSPNEVYERGYSIAIKQKFYHSDKVWGMWYFGHEIRFTSVDHFANLLLSPLQAISESEEKFEYSILIGDRILRDPGESGITVDVFLGVGVGYRNRKANHPKNPVYEEIFNELPTSKISIPFRFGVNLGYVF